MKLTTYLNFDGNCEEALKFYEKALGATVVMMMRYGDSPLVEDSSPEFKQKIIHGRLAVGEDFIMGSDSPPGRSSAPAGFSVNINVESTEEAERLFKALSEGGEVHMPIGETFWAHRFGMLKDKFGVCWMVNYEKSM